MKPYDVGVLDLMDGSSEVGSKRRGRLHVFMTVILAAALVVVSVLSTFLYVQMKDYHDAKYRSQHVIMTEIKDSASDLSAELTQFTNTSHSLSARFLEATISSDELGHLSGMVNAVREMYLDDEEKNSTFASLIVALGHLDSGVFQVYMSLLWNSTGTPMHEDPDLNAKLLLVSPMLLDLSRTISAGLLGGASFEKHPYSVVDKIDLQAVREIAASIIAIFPSEAIPI